MIYRKKNSKQSEIGRRYDIGFWQTISAAIIHNGNTFTPISSLSEAIRKQTIVINGVSKTYAMTPGWRVGLAAGDPEIIGAWPGDQPNNFQLNNRFPICCNRFPQEINWDHASSFDERLKMAFPFVEWKYLVCLSTQDFISSPNVKNVEMKGYTDVTELPQQF